ncbi:MAG: hypothetical protein KFW09_05230 [Oscillospiraceae bacterium]|nr:hypothetical protein [Oscillospiraceae bacterium]
MKKNELMFDKIDNAGIMFPATTTINNSNVFRISVVLKEDICPDILLDSVNLTLKEIPSFNVRLKRGFFWNYFVDNPKSPLVMEEDFHAIKKISNYENKDFLFKVSYFNRRINLEIHHVLSDGSGAIVFLKQLSRNYIAMKYNLNFIDFDVLCSSNQIVNNMSRKALSEDVFNRFLEDESKKLDKNKKNLTLDIDELKEKSYSIVGTESLSKRFRVIQGIFSCSKLKKQAKLYDVSITTYLTSLFIWCIYKENYIYNPKDNKNINIGVPIDLRNYFKSFTTRNFFSFICIDINFKKNNYNFKDLILEVRDKMKEKLTIETIKKKISYNIVIQNNLISRFTPLFLKNKFLKSVLLKGEKGLTAPLSNLGLIKMDEPFSCYIERFDFFMEATKSRKLRLGIASYNDTMVCSFSSLFLEKDIERSFFKYITDLGIDVTVISNEV